jgi:hypothetical protein
MTACADDNLESAFFMGMPSFYAGLAIGVERHRMLAVRLSGWHHAPQ